MVVFNSLLHLQRIIHVTDVSLEKEEEEKQAEV